MKQTKTEESFIRPLELRSDTGSYNDWIAHAESDLAMARLAVGNQDIIASQICFHAQQAAEKALKAVLILNKLPFPFTHDLDQLVELAERGGIKISLEIQEAGRLTPFAVETRYPGSEEAIAESEYRNPYKLLLVLSAGQN